jgi:hypothetical protein
MKKILLFLALISCQANLLAQSRAFVRTQQTTDRIRKYSELSIDLDNKNNIIIGADKYEYKVTGEKMLKTNRYDMDYLKSDMRHNAGYSLPYLGFTYIKNSNFFNERASGSNYIIGMGRQEMGMRRSLLTKFNPANFPMFNYNTIDFIVGGQAINSGGIVIKPILDDKKMQTGFQVAMFKEFEITGGMILAILDNNLNILATKHIYDAERDISLNNIVQVQFPNNTITTDFASNANDFVGLQGIYNNYNKEITFAVIGTTINKTLNNNEAIAQHSNHELIGIINGDLKVNNFVSASTEILEYSKGTDLDFDPIKNELYTLGHSSYKTFHLSKFNLGSNYQLTLVGSGVFMDAAPSSFANNTSFFAQNIYQQMNGNSIKFDNGTIIVEGYQEAYKGQVNKLSNMGHVSLFNSDLQPISKKFYSSLYAFTFNRKSGTDYALFNTISSSIPFGEFGPKLLIKDQTNSYGSNNYLCLFNSDKISEDIKHSVERLDINGIKNSGCMLQEVTYNIEGDIQYNEYTILDDKTVGYSITNNIEKALDPDYRYAVCTTGGSAGSGGLGNGGGLGGPKTDPPPCPSDPFEDCDGNDSDIQNNPNAGGDPNGDYTGGGTPEGSGDDGDDGIAGDPSRVANTNTIKYPISVYKNVVKSFVPENALGAEIKVMSLEGKLIYTFSIKDKNDIKLNIENSSWPSGIYFYNIYFNGMLQNSEKVIVVNNN